MGLRICLALLCLVTACKDETSGSREARDPQRIVTLTPSATEVLVALGQVDKLVGRDQYSVEPERIRALPVLGDFVSPNVQAIVALDPQLVLLDQSQTRTEEALRALGVRTLSLAMHQLADVRSGLIEVGAAVGQEAKAQRLVDELDAQVQTFARRGRERRRRPKVLLLIDRAPDSLRNLVAAGPKTFLDELLTLVGGINIMSGSPVRYPQLSAEQIMRAAPDIIIDLSKSQGSAGAYDLISEVPAVAMSRVHLVDNPLLLSPTPRVGEALEQLFQLTELKSSL